MMITARLWGKASPIPVRAELHLQVTPYQLRLGNVSQGVSRGFFGSIENLIIDSFAMGGPSQPAVLVP